MPKPLRYYIFSYFPLYSPWHKHPHIVGSATYLTKDGELPEWYSDIEEYDHSHGVIRACMWMLDEHHNPGIVFVLDQAKEVYDHLIEWSEKKPTEWFTIQISDVDVPDGNIYGVVLFPVLQKSVDRWKLARLMMHGEFYEAGEIQIICDPLRFVSGVNHTFSSLKDRIVSPIGVGFLDTMNVNNNPSDVDFGAIIEVGRFDVDVVPPNKSCFVTEMLKNELEDMKCNKD